MRLLTGIVASAVLGAAFIFLCGILGMFMSAGLIFFGIVAIIPFFVSIVISIVMPTKKFWAYPVSFSLPLLLIGFFSGLALETFFTIGVISLFFSTLGAYIVFIKQYRVGKAGT